MNNVRLSDERSGTTDSRRLEVITSTATLDDIASAWRQLSLHSGQYSQLFQSYTWSNCWWKEVGQQEGYELCILAGYGRNELVFLWPLAKRKSGALTLIEGTGGLLSCYCDALIADDNEATYWFDRAFEFIRHEANVDLISLDGVRDGTTLGKYCKRLSDHCIGEAGAPMIDRTNFTTYDEFFSNRSKLTRKNQRRSWRQLTQGGSVEVCNDLDPADVGSIIAQALNFKRDWLRANGLDGKTIVSDRGHDFLVRITQEILTDQSVAQEVELRPGFLKINGKITAIGLAFGYQGCHYDYFGAFEQSNQVRGLGRCQLEAGIKQAFVDKFDRIDLLTPETEFKSKWTESVTLTRRYLIPLSLRGRVYRDAYVKSLRPKLKALFNAIPPTYRNLIRP